MLAYGLTIAVTLDYKAMTMPLPCDKQDFLHDASGSIGQQWRPAALSATILLYIYASTIKDSIARVGARPPHRSTSRAHLEHADRLIACALVQSLTGVHVLLCSSRCWG
jgi:hypothetical protein